MTTIFTIGHSTRTYAELDATLQSVDAKTLVDVRRFPHSRRQPEYNVDALRRHLFQAGVRYVYLGDELGGFRDPRVDSRHVGLSGSSFQGYADHMETPIFHAGLQRLKTEAAAAPSILMCSEKNFKKCHRRMLADRLVADGLEVRHVVDSTMVIPHALAPKARLVQGELVYDAGSLSTFEP
jgi:uncharacterized protein (DUF488 family)